MRTLALLALLLTLPALAQEGLVPVAGLVLDLQTGKAIAGATVNISGQETVTTDERGEWRQTVTPPPERRSLEVVVTAEARAPVRFHISPRNGAERVRTPTAWMQPVSGQLRGRVRHASGPPVGGARIELRLPQFIGRPSTGYLRVVADDEGRFGPVPCAAGFVTVSAYGQQAPIVRETRFVFPGEAREVTFDLVTATVVLVEGQVVAEDGEPVAGATIGCRPKIDHEAVTDECGRFSWPVPRGGCALVWFRKAGIASQFNRPLLLSELDRGPFVLTRVEPEAGSSKTETPDPAPILIHARVTDHAGRPLPGALVQVIGAAPRGGSSTDLAGRARLHLAGGGTRPVRVLHPGYPPQRTRVKFPESGELDLGEFRMPPPVPLLDFVAMDEKGNGIPEACLVRTDSKGELMGDAPVIAADTSGRIRCLSAARGVVLAPGRVARHVRDLRSADARVPLLRSASLRGVVIDAEGRPRSHVGVWLSGGRRVVTDGLGRFHFTGLTPGKKVRLSAWDERMMRRQIDPAVVLATPGEDEVRIVLED